MYYDIAKYPINEREGVIQAHFSQLRKWVDVPRYLLRNPYFRQHLQNQLKQQDEDYQQNLAEINEEQGEISDEESLTGTELTPPVLPKDDSDEDDDDFSYQLAEEDHHLLEELRKRQKEAQEKMLELINNDYSTFLSNSYRVLQESFDAAIGINESQASSGSNRLAEISKEDNITTNRFIQTDLTIPPEEEEEIRDRNGKTEIRDEKVILHLLEELQDLQDILQRRMKTPLGDCRREINKSVL